MNMHTGEKPCKCDICYKLFFANHKEVHTCEQTSLQYEIVQSEEKPTWSQTSTLERSLSNVMFVRGFMYTPEILLNIILYPVLSNNIFLLLVFGYHTHIHYTDERYHLYEPCCYSQMTGTVVQLISQIEHLWGFSPK